MNARPINQYIDLQKAYDIMNGALFDGTLGDCLITLHSKNKRALGYFRPNAFKSRPNGEEEPATCDEICLNPDTFHLSDDKDILSTLLHEMAHLWQQHFDKPSRGGYHNKRWAAKMKDIGLYPSNTGQPGGKETGQQMDHYIIEDGPFQALYENMSQQGMKITWETPFFIAKTPSPDDGKPVSPIQTPTTDKKKKVKYTCPDGCNVWGKPELHIYCTEHEGTMEPQ